MDALHFHKLAYENQAAKSATTASSTGKPGSVTRRQPSCGGLDQTVLQQRRDPVRIELAAGNLFIAGDIDPLGQPQSHQQELVGTLFAGQHLVGDDAVALATRPG